MTFEADITAFAEKAGASLDETVRGITIELFSGVIISTPIDTGRARGNWQTTTESPASGETDRVGVGPALAELNANAGGHGTVTFLTNNLPYIMKLEEGHSEQSPPYAMARGNFERVQSIVEEQARKHRV